jgi:uncharacterized membrane protein YqgA involved in biofilm formation
MVGTFINVVAIVVGAGVGVLVGVRLPERLRETVLHCLGLFTVVLGISAALSAFDGALPDALGRAAVLVVLGSLLAGGIIGELLDLDGTLLRLGERVQRALVRRPSPALAQPLGHPVDQDLWAEPLGPSGPPAGGSRFAEGFVLASLVFCIGPLTILGSLQDGLTGDYELLAVKSILDGFAALAFASALGVGVALSALPVLFVQGAISLSAGLLEGVLTEPMIAAMDAVGGVLVLGIGLRLLELKAIRLANLVPGLLIAPVVVALWP